MYLWTFTLNSFLTEIQRKCLESFNRELACHEVDRTTRICRREWPKGMLWRGIQHHDSSNIWCIKVDQQSDKINADTMPHQHSTLQVVPTVHEDFVGVGSNPMHVLTVVKRTLWTHR